MYLAPAAWRCGRLKGVPRLAAPRSETSPEGRTRLNRSPPTRIRGPPIPLLPTLAGPVSDIGSFLYGCHPRPVNGYRSVKVEGRKPTIEKFNVQIYINGTSLFGNAVDGFGATSEQSYLQILNLNAGDPLDLAVVFGTYGTFLGDLTGVDATISTVAAVPEPSALVLLSTALVDVAPAGWWRCPRARGGEPTCWCSVMDEATGTRAVG
jgi:hypothetical protein